MLEAVQILGVLAMMGAFCIVTVLIPFYIGYKFFGWLIK